MVYKIAYLFTAFGSDCSVMEVFWNVVAFLRQQMPFFYIRVFAQIIQIFRAVLKVVFLFFFFFFFFQTLFMSRHDHQHFMVILSAACRQLGVFQFVEGRKILSNWLLQYV